MWSIVGAEPQIEQQPDGRDLVAYIWPIERDAAESRAFRVEITNSALASDNLPSPLSDVVASKEAAAVRDFLHWVEPPQVVAISTSAIRPFPGSVDPATPAR